MTRLRQRVVLFLTCLALVACASVPEEKPVRQASSKPNRAYMIAVEKVADENGADVYWVNPPQERDDD